MSENISLDRIKTYFILIAEDDAFIRKVLTRSLQEYFFITTVENGILALELAHNQQYDVILTDIQMPQMNGYELVKSIRRTSNPNQNTPIIGLTTFSDEDAKRACIEAGMNSVISKPFNPAEVQSKILSYCQAHPIDNKQILSFDEALDVELLMDMFGDDAAYAKEMFSIFLEDVAPEIRKIPILCIEDNLTDLYILAHKTKPTLRMVGLSELAKKMYYIEQSALQSADIEEIVLYCYNFIEEFNKKIPILEKQLKSFSQENF